MSIPPTIRRKRHREVAAIAALVTIIAFGFAAPLWINKVPLVVRPVVFAER